MKGLPSRRPSPALVVAVIALVVAMVGTGYAATQLPKNSVGAKQLKKNAVTTAKIKKNAVTGAKVKKHTLTGDNINLDKLGTVPTANVANTANALAPLEATHIVGAPGEPAFEDGSTNYGTFEGRGHPSAGFFKDHEGVVHLQGFVKVGSGSPLARIFSLPPGYRPAASSSVYFNVFCSPELELCEDSEHYAPLITTGSNLSFLSQTFNGAVITLPNTIVSLDGVTFRAEG
jgi:hypothetical protein